MRKRTVFGSCVALVLAMAAVTAQQQRPGDVQQPPSQPQSQSPTSVTGQQQEMTVVGCIEAQAGGAPTATDFVLVSLDPAAVTGSTSTGRPAATGTSGTTTSRANASLRYSLSGTKERELRAGQRVEIIGKSSGPQNRSTSSESASTPPASGSTRDPQAAARAGANANMQMLEIVSYRVVPGNCNQ